MTPEEISEHFRLIDVLREMPDAERAERLTRLEAALATDPPGDLAMRLRALVGCYQPPRPLTRQEEIDLRFTGNHKRVSSIARERRWQDIAGPWPSCGTSGHVWFPGDGEIVCAHEALLWIAGALRGGPAATVATMDGRRDLEFDGDGFVYQVEPGTLGDATGTCTCPHDCAWSGPLQDMWIEGGHVVCPGCHEACPVSS